MFMHIYIQTNMQNLLIKGGDDREVEAFYYSLNSIT